MDAFDRVRLADGRNLDMRVSWPAGRLPLVFHHGTPTLNVPLRVAGDPQWHIQGAATPVRAPKICGTR